MRNRLIHHKFPPEVRVRKKAEFGFVFRKGSRHFSRCGKIVSAERQLERPRFAVVVSKKTAKLAVVRNRIRRIAKETFRHTQHSLPCQDIVFIAGKNCQQISNQELRQCIEKMLNRIKASVPAS